MKLWILQQENLDDPRAIWTIAVWASKPTIDQIVSVLCLNEPVQTLEQVANILWGRNYYSGELDRDWFIYALREIDEGKLLPFSIQLPNK